MNLKKYCVCSKLELGRIFLFISSIIGVYFLFIFIKTKEILFYQGINHINNESLIINNSYDSFLGDYGLILINIITTLSFLTTCFSRKHRIITLALIMPFLFCMILSYIYKVTFGFHDVYLFLMSFFLVIPAIIGILSIRNHYIFSP